MCVPHGEPLPLNTPRYMPQMRLSSMHLTLLNLPTGQGHSTYSKARPLNTRPTNAETESKSLLSPAQVAKDKEDTVKKTKMKILTWILF